MYVHVDMANCCAFVGIVVYFLISQGCTCHGVEPDETCLDCLRSKVNIGRYRMNTIDTVVHHLPIHSRQLSDVMYKVH